jgi:uncharacterized protein DUF4398
MPSVTIRPAIVRGLCWLLLLLGAACALVDTPTAELAVAQSAIREAEGAGAPEHAPAELASARDRLARAQVEARMRHYDESLFLAEQAEADARLAAVKARAASAEAALGAVQRGGRIGDRPAR